MRGRMLAARIKAHIATNPRMKIPTLKVFFDGKAIILQGVVRRMADLQAVGEIVDGFGTGDASAERTALRNLGYRVQGKEFRKEKEKKKGAEESAPFLFRLVASLHGRHEWNDHTRRTSTGRRRAEHG